MGMVRPSVNDVDAAPLREKGLVTSLAALAAMAPPW
jgi:hypothetical protein